MRTYHLALFVVISSYMLTGKVSGQWVQMTSSIWQDDLGCLFAADNDVFLTHMSYNESGLFLTTDNGETWTRVSNALTDLRVIATNGTRMFAGTEAQNDTGGVFLSTDGGSSWNATAISNTNVYTLALNGSTVLVGAADGVYVSSDSGVTWTRPSGVAGPYGNLVYSVAVEDSLALAGLQDGSDFLSTNGGKSWSAIPSSGASNYEPAVFVMKGTLIVSDDAGGVRVSTDTGASWSDYIPNSPRDVSVFAMSDTELFAATWETGVFAAANWGTKWINVSAGLSDLTIYSICVSDGYLFAVDDSGRVWRRPLSEMIVGVTQHKNTLPLTFSLSQNYPNPFNPSTTISYQLPVSKHVTLKVYDILGREVATLVDGFKSAGSYEVRFNASELSSGVYFMRLTAGTFSSTRKIMLTK